MYPYLLFLSRLGLDKRIDLVMYHITKDGKIVDHTMFHKHRHFTTLSYFKNYASIDRANANFNCLTKMVHSFIAVRRI